MREVRQERTGWRDMKLSERHRKWGWDCPAIDLDFLFLEYDKGKPSALIEYKHENAQPQYASHPSYQAVINLGNSANIPVFACRYADDFSWWKIVSLNGIAKTFLPERSELTEADFVRFLYKIRGYEADENLLNGLNVII